MAGDEEPILDAIIHEIDPERTTDFAALFDTADAEGNLYRPGCLLSLRLSRFA